MIDLYLKFPDQATLLAALALLGMTYTDEVGIEHIRQGSHQYALWEIGLIAPDPSSQHLNLRVIDPEFDVSTLAQYQVFPAQPRVVWA